MGGASPVAMETAPPCRHFRRSAAVQWAGGRRLRAQCEPMRRARAVWRERAAGAAPAEVRRGAAAGP